MTTGSTCKPFEKFGAWYRDATSGSAQNHPAAVCLSTVSADGWPEARYVALKEFDGEGFIFCTHAASAKVTSLESSGRAALTFWWDAQERQVRVQGTVKRLSREHAKKFFHQRSRQAQITSWASEQSRPVEDPADLDAKRAECEARFAGSDVPCPDHFVAYRLEPVRLEFLTFQANRLHLRQLFTRQNGGWTSTFLQP